MVFTPALCRLQSDPQRYRRAFIELFEAVELIGALFTSLCAVLAYPLTLLVLGPNWVAAAGIFAAFAVGAQFYLSATVCSWLFASQGRGKDAMRGFSLVSALSVAAYFVGVPFGPFGVAVACSAAGLLIHMPVLFYIGGRKGPVGTSDLWIGFVRYLPVWGLVYGAGLLAMRMVGGDAPLMQVGTAGGIGLLAGSASMFLMPASRRLALRVLSMLRDWAKEAAQRS
jgi:PST family polysaccharide transporter